MPLRIVIDVRYITDFGIGTYIRNLITGLGQIDRTNHYYLVGTRNDFQNLQDLPSNFEPEVYQPPSFQYWHQVAFPSFLRRFAPDLVHMPLNATTFYMPKPYVVTVHDLSSFLFNPRPHRSTVLEDLRLSQFRRGLLQAERIIAVSAATQRDVQNLLGAAEERIRLVYSAPDSRFLDTPQVYVSRAAGCEHPDPQTVDVLERFQIQQPFLLYAGRIRPHKNIPRIIEAFAVARSELEGHPEYGDLRLVIIGDEISKHPEVRRAVLQTRTQQWVRFLGFLPFETLKIFYRSACLFVFPSLYEGFGLPPLEAMASGTPVITSSVSSLPEVVGDAALVVHPENVFDIARGIREVLSNGDLREQLVIAGFKQARRFDWERTARETLQVYMEAARKD